MKKIFKNRFKAVFALLAAVGFSQASLAAPVVMPTASVSASAAPQQAFARNASLATTAGAHRFTDRMAWLGKMVVLTPKDRPSVSNKALTYAPFQP